MACSASPQVGIFWFVQEPEAPPRLIGRGVAVCNGEPYGHYVNYPGEHSREWPELKSHMSSFFDDDGHKDWPRGRILYNTATQAFEVYLNKQLQTPAFEAEIRASFNLPEATTSFASDAHYSQVRFRLLDQKPQVEGLDELVL